MGIGGKFWDILKPYARNEGPDFLRDKRVAVDLSYWIVQHETALKSAARKPHLRLTFFRTINLFAKFGAFPVFVVDGSPSPLKSQARILRFFRFSGVSVTVPEEGVSVERNRVFQKYVKECVELLELFGMPVLKADGEAEALCAQLNRDGYVDACITADSDAFLFGANCVIKCLRPNTKEPFECYNMSDIEAGLGLKRNHLIAISLLVGNDHDLNGVQGIGVETALRFVQAFTEKDILDGFASLLGSCCTELGIRMLINFRLVLQPQTTLCSVQIKVPQSQKLLTVPSVGIQAPKENILGLLVNIVESVVEREEKKLRKQEDWQTKVCNKIAAEPNFPNSDIIAMYLGNNRRNFYANDGSCMSWASPDTDMLVDFLVFHQLWEPSYIRQRMLPMLSTIYLREMAGKQEKTLLIGQYAFDSIQRVKIRYENRSFVIKWRKATGSVVSSIPSDSVKEFDKPLEEIVEIDEHADQFEEDDENVSHIHVNDEGWLLTDENVDLVRGAFPEEVDRFLREKEMKELKRRKGSSARLEKSPKSKGVQLSIKEFYRSTKVQYSSQEEEDLPENHANQDAEASKEKRKSLSSNLKKSVRRRLLFN
ncbi:hypothetical protein Tsubulata_042205 [Turnera subulata]|uniref:Flap endonuclease GEN-like 1 n=1 Tax=Turnera subulata TaxID=218843 RepID=A0A9Q0J8J6_9ROSI|nr:hypothetical protein Tsubulata_042205 [Turnera subulata]